MFCKKDSGVRLVVHGDDFTSTGTDKELGAVERLMKRWYDINVRDRLDSGEGDAKTITTLGRTLRWTEGGLEYEGDGKHRE